MRKRDISKSEVQAALTYGRRVYTRGSKIYAIGRKEVQRYSQQIDLSSYEGLQVVCSTDDSTIITVYRNSDFRGLRPGMGRGRHRSA